MAKKTTETTAPPTKPAHSRFDWFLDPPGWLTWGGLGAFVWKLYEFFVKRRDRTSDQQLATDAFWFETVVVPQILEPLLDFITAHKDRLASVKPGAGAANPYEEYMHGYQSDYAKLIARIGLLQIVSQSTYEKVATTLDELEGAVIEHCYMQISGNRPRKPRDIATVFSDTLRQCVGKFKELHTSYYARRKPPPRRAFGIFRRSPPEVGT